jgi:hypothetical protein
VFCLEELIDKVVILVMATEMYSYINENHVWQQTCSNLFVLNLILNDDFEFCYVFIQRDEYFQMAVIVSAASIGLQITWKGFHISNFEPEF